MHAFELDVMHKPPLVLGASLNPSSTVAKGATDPREAIYELLHVSRRTVEDSPESTYSSSMMCALRRRTSLTACTLNLPPQMNHDSTS